MTVRRAASVASGLLFVLRRSRLVRWLCRVPIVISSLQFLPSLYLSVPYLSELIFNHSVSIAGSFLHDNKVSPVILSYTETSNQSRATVSRENRRERVDTASGAATAFRSRFHHTHARRALAAVKSEVSKVKVGKILPKLSQ
jgi:hypothetical protein